MGEIFVWERKLSGAKWFKEINFEGRDCHLYLEGRDIRTQLMIIRCFGRMRRVHKAREIVNLG